MIAQETIREIKGRLDIVDVISNQMALKKIGKNYSACCPFHDEKTPSFVVNPNKQFYYCFGCGATGDLIKFYSEMNVVSFRESIRRLSELAGIDVTEDSEKLVPNDIKKQMLDDKIIMLFAQDYEQNGVKMTYKDKQRVKLARCRYEGLSQKWGAV